LIQRRLFISATSTPVREVADSIRRRQLSRRLPIAPRIFNHGGNVTFGITGDFAANPGLDVLVQGIEHGASELLMAAKCTTGGSNQTTASRDSSMRVWPFNSQPCACSWPPMLAQMDPADDSARSTAGGASAAREYRIAELAREAGITVRTLRYYQERKLLPPPRRTGRVGWYSQAHLNRLRIISQLLDRGHTLGGIGELLSAWEQGYDLADLLGFEHAMTASWSDEAPVPVTVAGISALFEGQVTTEVLEEAIGLGYIDIDGDRVVHVSRRLLDAAGALAREGIPLPAILSTARQLQEGLDKIASLFVELVVTHVLDRRGGAPPPREVTRLTQTIERLRPIARTALDAEFGRAMDRRARVTYEEFIRLLAAQDPRSGVPKPNASEASRDPEPSGGEVAAE
jgi:DNA-binding transcriptional MerR regulator